MAQASKAIKRQGGGGPMKWLLFGLIAFVFVLFGIIIWFAWVDGYGGDVAGEPRVIEPEVTEFRREPADPGGMEIANEGSQIAGVYGDDQNTDADERVLDPEPPLETLSADQASENLSLGQAGDILNSAGEALTQTGEQVVNVIGEQAGNLSDAGNNLVASGEAALASVGTATNAAASDTSAAADETLEQASNEADQLTSAILSTGSQAADEAADAVTVTEIDPETVPESLSANADTAADAQLNGDALSSSLNAGVSSETTSVLEAADALVAEADQQLGDLGETVGAVSSETTTELSATLDTTQEAATQATETAATSNDAVETAQLSVASEPAQTPQPVQETAPAAVTTAALASGYRVQLAAFRTTAAATSAWNEFQTRYQGELEGLEPNVESVNTDSGTLYRLQAGPFESRSAAVASCERIKLIGGDCFIVGPRS